MNFLKSIFLLTVGMVFAATPLSVSAADSEVVYTNDTGKGKAAWFGTSKKENYNVAMQLTGGSLVGMTVKTIRIPVESVTSITNLRVWLSINLSTKTENGKKVNDPDILTQTANVSEGWVEVTLESPYTITDEGVYVGYSFDINALDSLNSTPVAYTSEKHDGSFYVFTSRTYKSWINRSANGSLRLQVVLGNAKENAASASFNSRLDTEINAETPATFTLSNHGNKGIESFDYEYTVNGVTNSAHVDLGENKVDNFFNSFTTYSVTLPAIADKGIYPLDLTVTKVNGVSNEDPNPTSSTTLNVYKVTPKHRPLMEEYTGTWCGYCPRGYIGLLLMNKLYPDDFIGVSYHNGDPMTFMASGNYPNSINGYPAAFLDRAYEVDAYMGFNTTNAFGLSEAWETVGNIFTPVVVNASAHMSSDNSQIEATANVVSIADVEDCNYTVELIVTADDLHWQGSSSDSTSWLQSNYYATGYTNTFVEEEWKMFTEGSSYVKDLHFDDVAVATSRLTTGTTDLPTTLVEDAVNTATATFKLDEIINTSGKQIVQDVNKLHIIAVVADKTTGMVINANKAKVTSYADYAEGIATVKAYEKTGKAEFYDLNGRRLSEAKRGLNIVRTADGKVVKMIKK